MRIKAFSFHFSPHFTPGVQMQPQQQQQQQQHQRQQYNHRRRPHSSIPIEVLVLLFCTIGVYWSCLLFVVRLSIEATVNLTPVLCFHKSHVHFSKQYLDPDPHCLLQSRCLSRFLVHFPIFLDGSLVPIVQYIESHRNRIRRQRVHKKFIVIIIIERNLFESNKQETIHHRCLD